MIARMILLRNLDMTPDDMEDEDWDKLWEQTSEGDYYHYTIEEFEGDDEEWEEYDGEIYGKGE